MEKYQEGAKIENVDMLKIYSIPESPVNQNILWQEANKYDNEIKQTEQKFQNNIAQGESVTANYQAERQAGINEFDRWYEDYSAKNRARADIGISNLFDKVNFKKADYNQIKEFNFYLEDKSKYENNPTIQQFFKSKDDKFDKPLFDKWYSNLKTQYEDVKEKEFIDSFPVKKMTDNDNNGLIMKPSKSYNPKYHTLKSTDLGGVGKSRHQQLYDAGKIYDGTKLTKNDKGKVIKLDESALIKYDKNSWYDGLNLRIGYGGVIEDTDANGNTFLRTLGYDKEGYSEDNNDRNILGFTGINTVHKGTYIEGLSDIGQGLFNGGLTVLNALPQLAQMSSHFINRLTGDKVTKSIYEASTGMVNRMDLLKFGANEGYENSNLSYWGRGAGSAVGQVAGVYLTAGTGLIGVGSNLMKQTAKVLAGKNTATMLTKQLTMGNQTSAYAGAGLMMAMSGDEVAQTARLAGIKEWSTLAGIYMPISYGLNLLPAHLLFGSGARKGFEKIGLLNVQKEQARIIASEMDRLTPLLKDASESAVSNYAVKLADTVFQKTMKFVTNNKSLMTSGFGEGTTEGFEYLAQKSVYNGYNMYMNNLGFTKEKGYNHFTNKDLEVNNKELFESFVFGTAGGVGGKAIANYSQFGSLYDNSKEDEKSRILEYITNDKKYKSMVSMLEKQADGTASKNLFYQQGIDINGKVITNKNTKSANQEVAQNILDNMVLHKTTFDKFKGEVDKGLPENLRNAMKSFQELDRGKVLADLFKYYNKNNTAPIDLDKVTDNKDIVEFTKSDIFKKEAKQRLLAQFELPPNLLKEGFYEYYSKNNNEILKEGFKKNVEKAESDLKKYQNDLTTDDINEIESSTDIIFATPETINKVGEYYDEQSIPIDEEIKKTEEGIKDTEVSLTFFNDELKQQELNLSTATDEEEIDIYKSEIEGIKNTIDKTNSLLETRKGKIVQLESQKSNIDIAKNKSLSKFKELKESKIESEMFNITKDVFFNDGQTNLENINDKIEFFLNDKNLSVKTVNDFIEDELTPYLIKKKNQVDLIRKIGEQVNEGQTDASIEAYSPTLTEDEHVSITTDLKALEDRIVELVKKAEENEKAFTRQNFSNELELMGSKYKMIEASGVEINKDAYDAYLIELQDSKLEEIEQGDKIYESRKKAFEEYKENEVKIYKNKDSVLTLLPSIYQNDKSQNGLNTVQYLYLLTQQNPQDVYNKIAHHIGDDFYPSLEQILAIRLAYTHLTHKGERVDLGDNPTLHSGSMEILKYNEGLQPKGIFTDSSELLKTFNVDTTGKQKFLQNIYIIEGFEGTGKTKLLSILNKMINQENGKSDNKISFFAPKNEHLTNLKVKAELKDMQTVVEAHTITDNTTKNVNVIDEYTLLRTEEWATMANLPERRFLLLGDEGQATIQAGLKQDINGNPTMLIPRNNQMVLNQRSDFTVFRRINGQIREKLNQNKQDINIVSPIEFNLESEDNIGIVGYTDEASIPKEVLSDKETKRITTMQDMIGYQGQEFNKPYIIDLTDENIGNTSYNLEQSRILKVLLSAIGRASGSKPMVYIKINAETLKKLNISFKNTTAPVLKIENKESIRTKLRNNPLIKPNVNTTVATLIDPFDELQNRINSIYPNKFNITKEIDSQDANIIITNIKYIDDFGVEQVKKIIGIPTVITNQDEFIINKLGLPMFYTRDSTGKLTIYTETFGQTTSYVTEGNNDNVNIVLQGESFETNKNVLNNVINDFYTNKKITNTIVEGTPAFFRDILDNVKKQEFIRDKCNNITP